MTTEEIKKAAKDYVDKSINEEHIYDDIGLIKSAAMVDFMEGVEFANKHWQEKTRWIPITERLPEIREKEYIIYAKNNNVTYDYAILIIDDADSMAYLKIAFTHWKEID